MLPFSSLFILKSCSSGFLFDTLFFIQSNGREKLYSRFLTMAGYYAQWPVSVPSRLILADDVPYGTAVYAREESSIVIMNVNRAEVHGTSAVHVAVTSFVTSISRFVLQAYRIEFYALRFRGVA